ETDWGTRSFGENDRKYALAEIAYAQNALHYPVWGLSAASTPDDTGGYKAYGANQLGSNVGCCPYDQTAVTPHASFLALTVIPQQAYENIAALRDHYAVVGSHGFYDSVNPTTGSVAHRYLVLDQSMILAALDEVLAMGLQRYWAADPVGKAVRPYLAEERFGIDFGAPDDEAFMESVLETALTYVPVPSFSFTSWLLGSNFIRTTMIGGMSGMSCQWTPA